MRDQENALKRGVDVIVGTPGRIKVYFYFFSEYLFGIVSFIDIKLSRILIDFILQTYVGSYREEQSGLKVIEIPGP